MSEANAMPYEAPTVTYYGDVASLTASVQQAPNSDALCTGTGIPTAGTPSNVTCKANG